LHHNKRRNNKSSLFKSVFIIYMIMKELSNKWEISGKQRETFAFITAMRVVATVLITNTHLGGIWPMPQLAVGGLIGDLLFFVVSGFCLANSVENGFFKYMQKRILRISPTIILATLVYFFAGQTVISGWVGREGVLGRFVYPTSFHFVESIVLLYICLYPCIRFDFMKKHIPAVMTVVLIGFLIAYIFTDRTVKLDEATHFLVKLLFFEAMLFGVYTRQNMDKKMNPVLNWVMFLGSVVIYLVSKMFISEKNFCDLQILIFFAIFCVGATAIRAFASIEHLYAKLSKGVAKIIKFVAELTLEIYVVQTVLISIVVSWKLPFIVRFPLIVTFILGAALICNRTSKYLVKFLGSLVSKCLNKNKVDSYKTKR